MATGYQISDFLSNREMKFKCEVTRTAPVGRVQGEGETE